MFLDNYYCKSTQKRLEIMDSNIKGIYRIIINFRSKFDWLIQKGLSYTDINSNQKNDNNN